MAVVVFKMITLVFEGVESFIFNFPTGTATVDHSGQVQFAEGEIGNPDEMQGAIAFDFPIFKKVDQNILVGGIQRNLIDEAKTIGASPLLLFILSCCTPLLRLTHRVKQKSVIAFFNTQDKAKFMLLQGFDMRRIGT